MATTRGMEQRDEHIHAGSETAFAGETHEVAPVTSNRREPPEVEARMVERAG